MESVLWKKLNGLWNIIIEMCYLNVKIEIQMD